MERLLSKTVGSFLSLLLEIESSWVRAREGRKNVWALRITQSNP